MAKTSGLNPLRRLVEWAKRVILETAARELAESASDATGYVIDPVALEYSPEVPTIEYVEA